MSISFTRYIDITSAVGAGAQIVGREFMGRLFTTNPLLPTHSFIQFSGTNFAAEVGDYFGFDSDEYLRALYYATYISKNITRPRSISFARWVDVAVAPTIFGAVKTQTVAMYSSITNGTFGLTIGGVANTFTVDFTGVLSLADVAAAIEAEIQTAVGIQWTAANVTFNVTRGSFDFVGGNAVVATITVQQGVGGTPIGNLIGWLAGAILSDGSLAETITATLQASYDASNNFGSFLFMPILDLDEITEAATWTDSLNIRLMYLVPVLLADTVDYSAALFDIGGTGITLAPLPAEYPEQLPMMIFAATNYNGTNSVQNYMFQQSILTPSVSTDILADTLDALKINYYGQTQEAGQSISFYQRGTLTGLSTSPSDMGTYANEIWLKDAMGVSLMSLLLALPYVPANASGKSQLLGVMQPVINQALLNGTISVGKTLNSVQKIYISEITGDPNAWYQVQNVGYWLNIVIEPLSGQEFKAVYTLVYSKNDVIRKVEGSHILI